MPYSLAWLPDVLRNAGLKVAIVNGWEDRGRAEMGPVYGVICHYTEGSKDGNMPSLDTLIKGRAATDTGGALAGPLAQLGLGRDGTYYVIAAGRCNHAGAGSWLALDGGNENFIGIEAENTGHANDSPWPAVQTDAYHRGVAAILKYVRRGAEFCAGHKEYALPHGRKVDPNFDMDEFRTAVTAILDGTAPPPQLIPAKESSAPAGGGPPRPTLRRGQDGDFVKEIQKKLGVEPVNGQFGPKTEAAVREVQRRLQMVPDGIVGPKTWAALDALTPRQSA